MRTLITKLLKNEDGPKIFFSSDKKVIMHFMPLNQIENVSKIIEYSFEIEGVYMLLGKNAETGSNLIYIGEADNLVKRMKKHARDPQKAFAEDVIFISSKDKLLSYSTTELYYLEKKLISIFKSSKYYDIENKNNGQGRNPTALEALEVNEEIETIKLGLASLGVFVEEDIESTIPKNELRDTRDNIEVFIKIPHTDLKIKGILHANNNLTILAGNIIKNKSRNSENSKKFINSLLEKQRNNPKKMKILGTANEYEIEYLKDVRYKRPSGASNFVVGGENNGWKTWKETATGQYIDKFRVESK